MYNIESRLKKLEHKLIIHKTEVYFFSYGEGEEHDFRTEEEFNKEIEGQKYDDAIVILDLWRGADEPRRSTPQSC